MSRFRATVVGRSLPAVILALLAFTTQPWQPVLFAAVDPLGSTAPS